jgi:hypothetical protein
LPLLLPVSLDNVPKPVEAMVALFDHSKRVRRQWLLPVASFLPRIPRVFLHPSKRMQPLSLAEAVE